MSLREHTPADDVSTAKQVGALLKGVKFFQDFEPAVQAKLPEVVTLKTARAGGVIFRQGDLPGHCYVVFSGEVGIFCKSDDELRSCSRNVSPRTHAQQRAAAAPTGNRRRAFALTSNLESPSHQRGSTTEGPPTPQAAQVESPAVDAKARRNSIFARRTSVAETVADFLQAIGGGVGVATAGLAFRRRTAESLSWFSEVSFLGQQVKTLGPGCVFGELALLQDQPRSASVKCLTDCQLLVIRREDYDRVLKEVMINTGSAKLKFLIEHVPGMKDVPAPRPAFGGIGARPHASYYFNKARFLKGHAFLTQGLPSVPCVYVVVTGTIEFRRSEAQRPGTGLAKVTETAARMRHKLHSNPLHGSLSRLLAPLDVEPSGEAVYCELVQGGIFGALPLPGPEPFTVAVASPWCEVLCAAGPDFGKLPLSLQSSIREYLAQVTAWRLRCRRRDGRTLGRELARSKTSPILSLAWVHGDGLDLMGHP